MTAVKTRHTKLLFEDRQEGRLPGTDHRPEFACSAARWGSSRSESGSTLRCGVVYPLSHVPSQVQRKGDVVDTKRPRTLHDPVMLLNDDDDRKRGVPCGLARHSS